MAAGAAAANYESIWCCLCNCALLFIAFYLAVYQFWLKRMLISYRFIAWLIIINRCIFHRAVAH